MGWFYIKCLFGVLVWLVWGELKEHWPGTREMHNARGVYRLFKTGFPIAVQQAVSEDPESSVVNLLTDRPYETTGRLEALIAERVEGSDDEPDGDDDPETEHQPE